MHHMYQLLLVNALRNYAQQQGGSKQSI